LQQTDLKIHLKRKRSFEKEASGNKKKSKKKCALLVVTKY